MFKQKKSGHKKTAKIIYFIIPVTLLFLYCGSGKNKVSDNSSEIQYNCPSARSYTFQENEQNKLKKQNDLISKGNYDSTFILDHCRTQFEFYVSNSICTNAISESCSSDYKGNSVKNDCAKKCGYQIQSECKKKMAEPFLHLMNNCPMIYKNETLELK